MKRVRTPSAKPGELKAAWGREGRWSSPSVVYCWGAGGADKCDGRFLAGALEDERFGPASLADIVAGKKNLGECTTRPSILAELEARGYDLTTLRLTIQMKPNPANTERT